MRFVRCVRFAGWGITFWLGVALTAACLALLLRAPDLEAGVRAVLRTTARTSHFFLMLAFCARPLWELAQHRPRAGAQGRALTASGWLLRQRRYLGNALTVSHTLHLGAVIALPLVSGEHYNAITLAAGGALMALIAALAATSSDAAVRVLGKNWKRLHRACIWALAVAFTLAFLPPGVYRAENIEWQHVYGVGLGALAFALRAASWKRRR